MAPTGMAGPPSRSLLLLLLCLAGAATAARHHEAGSLGATWKDPPQGPRQCRAHWDPHIWVEHKELCVAAQRERFGCELYDFQHGKRMRDFGTEVHWLGGNYGQSKFLYGHYQEGTCSGAYHMPDYCSRAIVSELSTVYDGKLRIASLLAGAKVLFTSKEERCSTAMFGRSTDKVYAGILDNRSKSRACWGLARDWRMMWCSKYARCRCDPSSGECGSDEKVQCCRDMYQLFLDGHPRERERFYQNRPVTAATAQTYVSLRVGIRDPGGAARETWLRVAYRSHGVPGGPPRLFVETSRHATFRDADNAVDLCGGYQVGSDGAAVTIHRDGSRHATYNFSIDPSTEVGPGLLGRAPRSGPEMSGLVNDLASKYCRPSFFRSFFG